MQRNSVKDKINTSIPEKAYFKNTLNNDEEDFDMTNIDEHSTIPSVTTRSI